MFNGGEIKMPTENINLYSAYILYEYEGGTFLGSFDSEEKAQKAILFSEFKGDGSKIIEHKLK